MPSTWNVGDTRGAISDDRMIVGVERSVTGKVREGPRAGDETSQQGEIVVDAESGGARRRIRQTPAHPADVEAIPAIERDETQHGRFQAVGGEHRPAARIDGDERPHDAAQGVEIELMQRQPLAEEGARLESASRVALLPSCWRLSMRSRATPPESSTTLTAAIAPSL